jgi:tetratricopeptide (TPR) repeat protein
MVDGPTLGALLAETQVSVLVLNACRSAHAEPLAEPSPARGEVDAAAPHARVRAYGSLAQEVMDAGVAGVVAMRYNVYVVTAAQFVADLYAALRQGQPLGQAVSLGRKQLNANPVRDIAGERVELQDWPVPVVYEAAPLQLFPLIDATATPRITLRAAHGVPGRGILDPKLPSSPDAGFFGRDETLLALDRRFDTQRVVLLHGYAGSGKTATAAEFARWYALTGGVAGPVLFTSFERPRPLARVLDDLEPFFGKILEAQGFQWLALTDADRRDVALQLLRQVPVLWIWDNVEEVSGFPTPAEGALSPEEQQELSDFLRAARDTEAKILLTSRRDERKWLGDLPARIESPPMPVSERIELARSLAEKRGRQIADVPAWLPVLGYTEGNPLTLTLVVGHALRDGLSTREEINGFVDKLRAGEAELNDNEADGRTRSLAASLNYGFEHAFTEEERKVLAQLRFFQTVANIDVLYPAIHPDEPHTWNLNCGETPAEKLSREALAELCSRAADIGLLTQTNDKVFLIHPALPWFFRKLFAEVFSSEERGEHDPFEICATRAYVEAVGALGAFLSGELNKGNEAIGRAPRADVANLRHALELAIVHGWWPSAISPMIGLGAAYEFTGQSSEWKKLVEDVIPAFVDLRNDGPLHGAEEHWSFVTSWRIELARREHRWEEAKRLLTLLLEQERLKCTPLLSKPKEELTPSQWQDIANLAKHEIDLGSILGELNNPECVVQFDRAIELSDHISDPEGQAHAIFGKGDVYATVEAIRDFEVADRCYRDAYYLVEETNRHFRARCLGQRGYVALERFKSGLDPKTTDEPDPNLIADAIRFYEEGLQLLGDDSPISDRLTFENQLCNCFNHASRSDLAIPHCQEAIRLAESSGDLIRAAGARGNMARALAQDGKLESGLAYAEAARRKFELYLGGDAAEVSTAQGMIDQINERLGRSTG